MHCFTGFTVIVIIVIIIVLHRRRFESRGEVAKLITLYYYYYYVLKTKADASGRRKTAIVVGYIGIYIPNVVRVLWTRFLAGPRVYNTYIPLRWEGGMHGCFFFLFVFMSIYVNNHKTLLKPCSSSFPERRNSYAPVHVCDSPFYIYTRRCELLYTRVER